MRPYKKYDLDSGGRATSDLKIRVAVGNMKVDEQDFDLIIRKQPNRSDARYSALNGLLNAVSKFGGRTGLGKIDLLVLPEMAVPYNWMRYVTSWSDRVGIGLICGIEHQLQEGRKSSQITAYNKLLSRFPPNIGPRVSSPASQASVNPSNLNPLTRIKRYYSPNEEFVIVNMGLQVPPHVRTGQNLPPYHLVHWRGVRLVAMNCYEIANIADRAAFRSKVDLLICSEYNRDVNYFSNIVESASRDLHCFVVQANNSRFGDSRVVSPSKTELMTPLTIKGGDNFTYLTMELEIGKLRQFQRKLYPLQKDDGSFKPTPPGFDRGELQRLP